MRYGEERSQKEERKRFRNKKDNRKSGCFQRELGHTEGDISDVSDGMS